MAQEIDWVKLVEACPAGDGWGPPVTSDTTLNGVPYAPFSKGDKLGRMADWTSEGKDRDGRGGRAQYNRNFRLEDAQKDIAADYFPPPDQQVYGAGHAISFNAPPAEDESTFSVVSNTRDSTKTRYGRGAVFTRGRGQRGGAAPSTRGNRQAINRTAQPGGRQGYGGFERGGRGGGQRGRRFGWKDYDKPARNRDASINIKADWKLLEEIDYNRLAKLNLDADEGEDIDSYGFVYGYDRSYDKPPVKGAERRLNAIDRAAYNVTTSSDPVIQELADKGEASIFATDSILSMLMCSPRSVYPWDIVISVQGNKVFLDKRDNAALDMVTVNENAADAPLDASDGNKDSLNQPGALAEEATYINHNFANQVVIESESQKLQFPHANPFYNASEDTDPPASKAYKYRKFDLSTNDEEENVYLVVRTEVDAVQKNAISGDDQLVTLHALNEFDSKAQGSGGALDWRTKLVSQRGAVVATEMKNNSCKLARWTVQSILARADVMKLGFVSRANPKSNDKHVILGVVGWKPRDFANQMNLSLSNGWGIVRTIADMCLKREQDGKYVLVKDPNKSILRLYEVPAGSLDEEDEQDEVIQEEGEDAEE
ncbi:eukaryotic translation initiation factor 3 subunit D [Colletotrichum musicola]|uniref:Eukaryotic translation initiation factor 3 subunit D n=2 Tax=Colletotrichum orchidearum species complex TaxID=2707337 RepID=A0A8H6U8A0_9PEZI|nr:eukaryotic translation initiation factor 3 subunit D [Colletotrichum plurivorum]KAF6843630.1 eukaryotic translation initiation factor 3 subunit D [Colletotrichum musicola]